MNKLLATLLVFSSAIAAENPKVYVDMSPVWLNYESKGINSDFKPTGFKWTAGYLLTDFNYASVALEGSAMLGVKNDSKATVLNSNGDTFTNAKMSLDSLYSLQLKSMIPITESFNANLYLGGTRGKTLSSSNESSNTGSYDNSVSYGAGLEYWLPADVSLHVRYMQYFKNLSTIEFGLGFRF